MTKKDLSPITIIVEGNEWKAYGNQTRRSIWLFSMLNTQGGISENVPDGTYHFNVVRKGLGFEMSLTEAEG